MKRTIYTLFLFCLLLSFEGCNEKKNIEFLGHNKEILKNWGENIIVPTYKNYQAEVTVLANDAKAFQQDRTEKNFEKLKASWLNAYKAFQKVLIFNFNFAENTYLVEMANTYPTNVEAIEKNITLISENKADEISLKPTHAAIQRVYQGFPALDYLLFEDTHTFDYYKTAKGDSACTYMVLLTQFLKQNIESVVNHWEQYIADYVEDTDISTNGAYATTINSFIKAYEKNIRAEKVGYAAGAINVQQGKPSPEIIEAYYNGKVSKELLRIAVQSSQDFFNGKYFGNEQQGKSLRSALIDLNQERLVNRINQQYAEVYEAIENTPNSLKETAISDNAKMRELYDALQKNVAFFKTYMLAALSVQVGYQDTDGD